MSQPPERASRLTLAIAVLGTCLGVVLAAARGPSEASAQLAIACSWGLAVLYGGAAILAGFLWRRWGGIGAYLVGLSFAGLAVSSVLVAVELWRSMVGLDAQAAARVDTVETSARVWVALIWAVSLTPPIPGWLERLERSRRSLLWWVGATIAAAVPLISGWAASPAFGALRFAPTVVLCLMGLVAIDIVLLVLLRRRTSTRLTRRLLSAAIPWAAVQVLVSAGLSHSVDPAVLLLRLLLILVVVSAAWDHLIEEVQTSAIAEEKLSRMQSDLDLQTQELARVDRELADQQRQRQASQRQLRLLEKAINRTSVGVTITDTSGRIIFVNPADAAMHGYRVDELIGQPATLFAALPEAEEPRPGDVQLWSRERPNRTRDGRVFPARLISDLVMDESGRPEAVVTLCEDISVLRDALEAIEQRDRILAAIGTATGHLLGGGRLKDGLEAALGALGAATGSDRVVYQPVREAANAAGPVAAWTRKLAGEPVARISTADLGEPGEVLRRGEPWVGGTISLPEPARGQLLASGTHSLVILPVRTTAGAVGTLRLETGEGQRTWSPTEIEALGAAARALGAGLERDRFLRELENASASYRDLIEGASDIIQSVDQTGGVDGRFLFVNPAWCEALGYSVEQSREMTLWQIIPERLQEPCRAQFERLQQGGGPVRLEITFRTRSGGEVEVEGIVGGRFEDGLLVATLGIFRDVGERRRVERMKRDFLATVSHELRTPLTSMLGSLGLLRSGRVAAHPAKAQELLEIAERNGERLLRLINDLLDLQRLEAGELRFVLTPTPIGAVLTDAQEGIAGMADLLKVRVALEPPPTHLAVLADRDRLNQVLYNLLSNAIKFSPTGETVRLGAELVDGMVEISVADRGPGIPTAFRARLFEKFAQAETAGRVGGSGLGLSISKRLVEGLGGSIRIDSEEGRGTVVTVSFPLLLGR